ncbi:hypothetical protein NDU88_002050 [Pleurodeles waltl]|uniref:Uncharacterized protein n=1 Tax=Pleurodeles waltl TaxID=8319 RepID=A0AAV7Q4V9_PLEWA|nr:hypothetical protein NDU88_002050 [Pleurodeles waltl]
MAPRPEGAHWVGGVLRACCGDVKRDPAWTQGASPKETQQQGGGWSQWAPIARRSAPAPGVGAERTRGLTLRTHKNLTGLHRGTEGDGGGPKSAPQSRREKNPGGWQQNVGRGAFRPRTVMSNVLWDPGRPGTISCRGGSETESEGGDQMETSEIPERRARPSLSSAGRKESCRRPK